MKRQMLSLLLLLASVAAMAQGPTTAHVVFYRPKNAVITTHLFDSAPVWIDDRKLGSIDGDKYVTAEVSPGRHTFRSSDKRYPVVLEVEAGRTYYLREDIRYGSNFPHSILTPVDEATGMEQVKHAKAQ